MIGRRREPASAKNAKRASAPLVVNPRFANFRLEIRRSAIEGVGVFAEETIPKGKKVIEYAGTKLTRREALRRFLKAVAEGRGDKTYYVALDHRFCIDGADGGSGAEWINHGCDPNLRERRMRGHVIFFSLRRVGPGEELTTDYRFSPTAPKVPCKCGAAKCRGSINLLPKKNSGLRTEEQSSSAKRGGSG